MRDTAPTGTATIVRCHGDNRIVVDAGANAALTSDEVCAALDDLAEPGDVFLAQLECDFPTTVDALAYAREMGLYTMPAFNNDEVIIPSFIHWGVAESDAYDYSAIGCVETAVPGKWGYRCTGMLDYLDWYGDFDFRAVPFNEVDNLILAQISYLDLAGVVPPMPSDGSSFVASDVPSVRAAWRTRRNGTTTFLRRGSTPRSPRTSRLTGRLV